MITPKEKAEMDQSMVLVVDMLPLIWYNLFVNLCKQGFSELQALDLIKTYIMSQGSKS